MASASPLDFTANPNLIPQVRTKSWTTSLLLLVFLGGFSAHRFYNGKVGTAILQLLTLGGFGIWLLIDYIMIILGTFTDKTGTPLRSPYPQFSQNPQGKSISTTLLLFIFLGGFAAHRFYVGKIGTGILYLITFGGLGIWTLVDFIVLVTGGFQDAQGQALVSTW
jgi:TM2 domain-containing membrane protein YozV